MKPFKAPLDDILFTLNHVAGASALPDWDADFAAEIGRYFATFAEGEIAPLDEHGDAQGCQLQDGRVSMPDGFQSAYQAYAEQGWPSLTAPVEYGGQGLGSLMLAITSEIFSGANHSLQMVVGLGPGAIRTLLHFGSSDQKARYIPELASGKTIATMCLTEPGAGSDLSRVRCKASPMDDGWRITGEKIFISGGDQNISDRILHLVLARTSDDGVKGLSLFLCPCTRGDGRRNAVSVTRIEEKMGLHASPTCQLAFDGAEAELIGDEGEGLQAMFTMMNHARADVALQGGAHAARAYDIASTYAAERIQGRNPDGSAATLDQHADVRRMLNQIDGLAMTGRAMAHLACVTMERGNNPALVEFLTPLTKVYCTEAGIRAAELGMQVLGGYGYLREYRLEQTYRDARITLIYEGANGIHERMLATRLATGATADAFEGYVAEQAERAQDSSILEALQTWRELRARLDASDDPAALAHQFMYKSREALLACIRARIGQVASFHPDPSRMKRLSEFRSAE
ncbi:acyl-CoA dehydrogenase family protein [Phaeobacter sp. C3_T13_0]|uniref:acyl-CoA dehydrogenase family protein n=1 Tax=Phaeobacter cretensis TaxID=3342641 RepID=UPI0039BC6166